MVKPDQLLIMSIPIIKIKHLKHRNNNQIALDFKYDQKLISQIKKIEEFKWSATHRCWYIENNKSNLKNIFSTLKASARIDSDDFFTRKTPVIQAKSKPLNKDNRGIRGVPEQYTSLLIRRRYSINMRKIYTHFFSDFINHFPQKKIDELDK